MEFPFLAHQQMLTPTTTVSCSNGAKTRNLLKFAAVPQTHQHIPAVTGPNSPYCKDIIHVAGVLLFNKFFPRLSIHALVAKI